MPAKKPGCLLWGTLAFFMLLAIVLGILAAYQLAHPHIYDRMTIQSELHDATPEQVRSKLGKPADAVGPTAGGTGAWTYHNRTRDPQTGELDEDMLITFEKGRVQFILFSPPRGIITDGTVK